MGSPSFALFPIAALAVLLTVAFSGASECGDVSGGGDGVHASDALAVLRRAVGQDIELQCVTGECLALEPRVAEVERRTPILRDANGVELGTLVSASSGGDPEYEVILPTVGKLVRLYYEDTPLAPTSLVQIQNNVNPNNVRFTQANCTGDAIISTDLDPAHLYSIVREPPREDHFYELVAPIDGPTMTGSRFVPPWVEDDDGCENVVLQAEPGEGEGWWRGQEVQLPFSLPAPGPVRIDYPE